MKEMILTYDLGTSALKTVLFDLEGEIVALVNKEYPTYQPKPLWAEQKADHWWEALLYSTKKILSSLNESYKIIGIGLTSQRQTIIPIGSDGDQLHNAILWMDARAKEQTGKLINHFDAHWLHQNTGMIPDTAFTAPKILWLKEHHPEIVRGTKKFLQPRDFLAYKLTGKMSEDHSLASRTMMYDIGKSDWNEQIIKYVGVKREQLPELTFSDSVIGAVSKQAAEKIGLQQGIPVIAGGGDRSCEALGAGISGESVIESTGTTSNISYALGELPDEIEEKVLCSAHVLRDSWFLEQPLNGTGAILRWYRDNIFNSDESTESKSDYSDIDKKIALSPVGANNLLLLPFFMGTRSTRWNPDARGVLFGLTLSHKREDIGRAILEGVAYELRACIETFQDMGIDPKEIVVTGGGSKSSLWNHIKADITGKPVKVPSGKEASSRGVMLLVRSALGLSTEDISKDMNSNRYEPKRINTEKYDRYYHLYNQLYESVKNLYSEVQKI